MEKCQLLKVKLIHRYYCPQFVFSCSKNEDYSITDVQYSKSRKHICTIHKICNAPRIFFNRAKTRRIYCTCPTFRKLFVQTFTQQGTAARAADIFLQSLNHPPPLLYPLKPPPMHSFTTTPPFTTRKKESYFLLHSFV